MSSKCDGTTVVECTTHKYVSFGSEKPFAWELVLHMSTNFIHEIHRNGLHAGEKKILGGVKKLLLKQT